MNAPLGRVEDLPPDYYHGLRTRNTLPLWPSLRGFLPYGAPIRRTQPTMWRYRDIRPDVIRAGELAPIEKAERRVIVLCNPGLGIDSMMATPSIYIGLQLILPRETAPNHRHTPSAIRFVIEGEGGFTVVGGEKLPMDKGDLILTPSGLWHEHGHEGSGPVVWLDALDLPLIYMLEASCAVEGPAQALDKPSGFGSTRYRQGGVVPYGSLDARPNDYPLLRFPWREVKETLAGLARITAFGTPVHLAYVNPETGRECLPTLGFSVLMLRPGEEIQFPRRSCSAVLHIVEGEGTIVIDGAEYGYLEADTLAVPTHSQVRFMNASTSRASYVFVVDDAPLQRKLGIYSANVDAAMSR